MYKIGILFPRCHKYNHVIHTGNVTHDALTTSSYILRLVPKRATYRFTSVMGWFSGSSNKEPAVSSRQDRKKCWESRDAYFSCLDRAGVVKAGEEGVACSSELQGYKKDCARSWVCAAYSVELSRLMFGRLNISTNGG
jgi:hypothetical protein